MNYIAQSILISARASLADYESGDYGLLYSCNRTGTMNYDDSLIEKKVPVYDADHRIGWGDQPWGDFHWGYGDTDIGVSIGINDPGQWEFALLVFDSVGNYKTTGVATQKYFACLVPVKPTKPGGISQAGSILTLTR